jgi:tRNA(Ile)-lysidine synthetase-like protein
MTGKEEKYIDKIHKKIGQSLHKEQLLAPNDKILIGLSGGKDSLILLESLASRRKHIPFTFDLTAAHINVKSAGYQADIKYLENICKQNDVNFSYTEIDTDLENSKKAPCFACSWHRRKTLFTHAKENGCNKIALGHHMDDVNETLLLNMIYHGSISSMPAKLDIFDGAIQVIRPLIHMSEDMLITYAKIKNYTVTQKLCPHDKNTKRKAVRGLLDTIYEMAPNAQKNIFRSTSKIFEEYLP